MTFSFSILERSPVNSLHQKLTRLALTTMSRNLDQILTEASAKNLSLAAALESLADLELDGRPLTAASRGLATREVRAFDREALAGLGRDDARLSRLVEPEHRPAHGRRLSCWGRAVARSGGSPR